MSLTLLDIRAPVADEAWRRRDGSPNFIWLFTKRLQILIFTITGRSFDHVYVFMTNTYIPIKWMRLIQDNRIIQERKRGRRYLREAEAPNGGGTSRMNGDFIRSIAVWKMCQRPAREERKMLRKKFTLYVGVGLELSCEIRRSRFVYGVRWLPVEKKIIKNGTMELCKLCLHSMLGKKRINLCSWRALRPVREGCHLTVITMWTVSWFSMPRNRFIDM